MLVSDMIKKLETLRKEKGDLPVYFKTDYDTLYPLHNAWIEYVNEDQAEQSGDELGVGQPIVCVS